MVGKRGNCEGFSSELRGTRRQKRGTLFTNRPREIVGKGEGYFSAKLKVTRKSGEGHLFQWFIMEIGKDLD